MAKELTEEQNSIKKGEKRAIDILLAYYRKEAKNGKNYYIGTTQEKAEALDMLSCVCEFLTYFSDYRFDKKERFELDRNGNPVGVLENWRWRWTFDLSDETYDKMRKVFLDSMSEIAREIEEKGNSISLDELQDMKNVASQVMYFVYHYRELNPMVKNGEKGIGKELSAYLNTLRAEAKNIENNMDVTARFNSNRTSNSGNESSSQTNKEDVINDTTILNQKEEDNLSPRKKGELQCRRILLKWYRDFVDKNHHRFYVSQRANAQEFVAFSRVCGFLEKFDEYRFDDENEEDVKYNIDGNGEPMHPHKESKHVEWTYIDDKTLNKVKIYFIASINGMRKYISNHRPTSESERIGMVTVTNQVEYFINNYPALAKMVEKNTCGIRKDCYSALFKQQKECEKQQRDAEFKQWMNRKYITFNDESKKEILKSDFETDKCRPSRFEEREFV